MKKAFLLLSSLLISSLSYGVNNDNDTLRVPEKRQLNEQNYRGQTLTIYNSADYIDEELITLFEEETGAKVNYYTFDTNETMYNQFTLQPEGTYDLICTSDYMVQRMVREGLVEPINLQEECPIYDEYASPMVRNKLASMYADTDNDGIKDTSLDSYCAGYMWGTLGIIYDPYCSDTIREDVKSWDVFWDDKYENLISIKNSMRDTFTVGLLHAYGGSPYSDVPALLTEARNTYLDDLKNAYLESIVDEEKIDTIRTNYNNVIQNVLDYVITEEDYQKVIDLVKNELIELKKNIFGFEVDSGKNDIITGKIKLNLAWSGDAVYSIQTAASEGDGKVLEYYVPDDGSNIWYDGWVLPNKANRDLACAFIDFLSDPTYATQNMEYIGYTSFIASDDVFSMACDWYGCGEYFAEREYYAENEEGEIDASYVHYNDKFYRCIKDSIGNLPTNETYFEEVDPEEEGLSTEPYDLSFLFESNISEGRSALLYPFEDSQNALLTQYPDLETITRCAVMNDFEDANSAVVIMWGQIRAYTNMVPYYVFLGITLGAVLTFFIYRLIKKHVSLKNKRQLAKKSNNE